MTLNQAFVTVATKTNSICMTNRIKTTLAALVMATCVSQAGPIAFHNVRVFDGAQMVLSSTVVADQGQITAVGEHVAIPAGAQIIDGAGKTLLPGLIDAHAHAHSANSLRAALLFGVTTELDMFCDLDSLKQMRRELKTERGRNLADLRSAGILVTAPGGHGTEYGGNIPTLRSADDAQAFVDARIAEGSDYIKIVYDNGSAYHINIPTLDEQTLAAVIHAAHSRKKLAVVHIGTLQDAREAIEAGADGLAHLFEDRAPDPQFAKLVAAHHAFVVPTLTVLRSVAGQSGGDALAKDPDITPFIVASDKTQLMRKFPWPTPTWLDYSAAEQTVRELKSAAVPILVGTDSPNPGTAHGASVHQELEFLVHAGMTPTEALAAATSVPARCFHLDDRGRIAPGKRADLLLVEGDPTTNILATRRIVGVWKEGVELDRTSYRKKVTTTKSGESASNPSTRNPRPLTKLVSDFEGNEPSVKFGSGWQVSTDALRGGSSTAEFRVIAGGAHDSKGSLQIKGTVDGGLPYAWAGAIFFPGTEPMTEADLSSKKEISFWAKGDGRSYNVMFFATSRGFAPAIQTFVAGAEWKQYTFKTRDFDGLDGHDITGIFFGAGQPAGKFAFQIDDVQFK